MKIIFYLKYGHKFEAHLMRVKGLYINPKELISFVICDEEDN